MDPRLQRRVQRYGWDKAVGYYDRYWQEQLEPAQDLLLEMAELKPGERVLDVACGTGLVTFRAAGNVGSSGSVLGTDISQGMVDTALGIAGERGLKNVCFDRSGAEEIGFDDDSFDATLCSLGLMYVPDPVKALGEMRRVAKPGGRVVNAVWGRRDRCGWAEIFPIVDARVQSEVCPMFFQLGTGEALRYTMEKAGLGDYRIERISTVLHYDNDEDAIGAAFDGGPVALAYSRFDERTRDEAHEEYLKSIEAFKTNGGYAIPGEFVVARAIA
jgi:ubiquinone/menaquinone biosynthesis C-methylase UbiE